MPLLKLPSAQAAYDQALGLLQNGKNADALAVIDAAIAAGARDPSLYNLKGLADSELGRDEEAEESFRDRDPSLAEVGDGLHQSGCAAFEARPL